MQPRPQDRKARQQHGAELAAAVDDAAVGTAAAGVHVEGRAVDGVVVRQQPCQDFGLVVLVAALPQALDFLQRDHVCVGHDLCDAPEVIAPVGAEAVLDIVADEFHEAPMVGD